MASAVASKDDYGAFVLDLCATCRKDCTTKCSGCSITSYCSVKCQRVDRRKHQRLMQCAQGVVSTVEEVNKIRFGEMLNVQVFFAYVFAGDYLHFGENEIHIDEFMQTNPKLYKDFGMSTFCEELMNQQIFKTYKGDIYYHNTCFGFYEINNIAHFPTREPVKIASSGETETLTPMKLLQIVSRGVRVTTGNELQQYADNDLKPLFTCTVHNNINCIQILQFSKGVLLLFHCY